MNQEQEHHDPAFDMHDKGDEVDEAMSPPHEGVNDAQTGETNEDEEDAD